MAKALFRMASMNNMEQYQPPEDSPLPYFRHDACSYIQTRIRVEQDTGTAADNALFFQELVPRGVRFDLRIVYLGTWDECQQNLLPALALLNRPEGTSLGKGYTQGNGRLRLVPGSLEAQVIGFDPLTCARNQSANTAVCLPPPVPGSRSFRVSLRLDCDGPFLILDPARHDVDSPDQEGTANNLNALLQKKDTPDLLATSLMGALRARLAWLSQLASATDGDDPGRVLKPGQVPAELTTTERLFGVTGWRGLVRVADIELEAAGEPWTVPRVALDRFTAGPMDGALFFTHAYVGVKCKVSLVLEGRQYQGPGQDQAQGFGAGAEPDESAFRTLIDNLIKPDAVLMLGHGTNQGFGWFRVKEVA